MTSSLGNEQIPIVLPSADSSALLSARGVQLLRRLREWAESMGPDFAPQVTEAAALALAASAPWSTADELVPPAKVGLWMQVADDRFDRASLEYRDVPALAQRCIHLAHGAGHDPADTLERALADVTSSLSDCRLHAALAPLWAQRFSLMMRAWCFEWSALRALAEGGAPIELDTYLQHHHSFGLGPICVAWWMSTGEPDLTAHLDILLPAVDAMELAVRLANDLRTADREHHYGGSVNALLLGADQQDIDTLINRQLQHCHVLLRPLTDKGLRTAIALGRMADWLVTFYRVTDARLP
ncbi:hypothetical protein ACH429_09975 [Streptomyces pathocidini]|uniref:Terpene synthase n=1 Tax=Streptomyces pathocidini TaxID=1650571 RepID=A0ABW7USP6_9ACTN|nr:hypothetical protein [Streptomyces pathocidini]